MSRILTAIGLMSGTSLDGIDAALISTDGGSRLSLGAATTVPYQPAFRERLRGVLGGGVDVPDVAQELTDLNAAAVSQLLIEAELTAAEIDVIGFHGHTILHRPAERRTWQIGDGARLAFATGIDVVADFRSRDVAEGGQGAPLAPLYHAALRRRLVDVEGPVAVVNVGGVANVTWIAPDFDLGRVEATGGSLLAFDTGPGNALIDDWAARHTGRPLDAEGALASAGRVDEDILQALFAHPFFERPPPKSLDRDDFDLAPVARLSPEDGAATLTAFTAQAIASARRHFPDRAVARWLVCGGGARNPVLMAALAAALDGAPVDAAEDVGWDADAIEAQAFGFLAVRVLGELPITLPTTTGAPAPLTGGELFRAS